MINEVYFTKVQTKKNLVFRQGFLIWLHSTGLEPVTYGLAVRQASHKVLPTELRGHYRVGSQRFDQ